MESNVEFHIEDESNRLFHEIELMMKNIENSKLYAEMRVDLEQNETFQQHLFRVLGSHSHVEVVIYALGSIEYSYRSQFQLAIILLLKRDFSNWMGKIEIYDPVMSQVDILVFKKLGLQVLTINENCKRRVKTPTLFYLPFPCFFLIGNLLRENWSSSCINQFFLLTNSFHNSMSRISPEKINKEMIQRLKIILPFTREIEIKKSYEMMYAYHVFSMFSWHFFEVDPNIHMETWLPEVEYMDNRNDKSWLDKQRSVEKEFMETIIETDLCNMKRAEYLVDNRGPRHFRCNSGPPPPGWIKLNIYGVGTKGNVPGRYSGIFQDENGMCLGKYNGSIDVEDNVIVGLEALKNGLVRCMEGNPKAQNLIVESDDVILVLYVNGLPEPNEITMFKLEEISNLLEDIAFSIYHVYEEANKAARDLSIIHER